MSQQIEILLVEDNECDAELTIRALKNTTTQTASCMSKTGKKRSISFSVQALTWGVP